MSLSETNTMHDSLMASLHAQLTIEHIELVNESHMHSGPADAETHFKLTCVAQEFAGLSRVKRHQKVYGIVAEQLQSGVHALALHLFSPEEWLDSNQVPASPSCMGGSKG